MNKRKFLPIIFAFLPLFFVLWNLYSSPLLDLIPDTAGWHKIISGNKYFSIMAINNSDNTLWFAEFWGDEKINYFIPDESKTISLNTDSEIDSICISDRVWVIQTGTHKITSVDKAANFEVNYPKIDDSERVYCVATPDNKTIFIGDKLLATMDGQSFSQNYWTIEKELLRVVQEPSGKTWALTRDAEIYFAESLGSQWQLFGKIKEDVYQLKLIDGVLWLGLDEANRIYRWNLSDKSPETFVLKSTSNDNFPFLVTVVEVAPNIIWIVSTNGIWEYQNGEMSEIPLPNFAKRLHGSVFDRVLKKLYLATDRGIYYKEIPQP